MRPQTEVPHVYKHTKRSHTHTEDPVPHVRVWWIMETPKTTQHALKSVGGLQTVQVGHYMEEEITSLEQVLKSVKCISVFPYPQNSIALI